MMRLIVDEKFNRSLFNHFKDFKIPPFNKAFLFLICHKVALGEARLDRDTGTVFIHYKEVLPFFSRREFDGLFRKALGMRFENGCLHLGTVHLPVLKAKATVATVEVPEWFIYWIIKSKPQYVYFIPFAVKNSYTSSSDGMVYVNRLLHIGKKEILIHTGTTVQRLLKSLSTSPSIYDQRLAILGLVLYSLFIRPDGDLVRKSSKNDRVFFIDRTFFDLFFGAEDTKRLNLSILRRKHDHYVVLLNPEVKFPTFAVPCRMKRLQIGMIEGYKSFRKFVYDLRRGTVGEVCVWTKA